MINILDIDWSQYIMSEYYNPTYAVDALTKLQNLKEEAENRSTYNLLLSSIGNNHAGTYYPAIISALPIVIEVAQNGTNEVARNCALEIITDWFCCFQLEIGEYNVRGIKEIEEFVHFTIKQFINSIPISIDESKRNEILILDLKEMIENDRTH